MKIERTKNATRNIFFGVVLKIYQILIPFLMRTAMIYLMGVQYLGLNSLFTKYGINGVKRHPTTAMTKPITL